MATTIGTLNWKPYQGGAAGTLIATLILNASVDTEFIVPTNAPYSNQNPLFADGVIIDNSQNNGIVSVASGPLNTTISQFSRDYVQLTKSNATIDVQFITGSIQLIFYSGTPPINPSLTNYGGALASVNAIGFTGGLDTGGSVRSITVSSNYAFGNGTLISFTSHAQNLGPLTLKVNGQPPIPIVKPITKQGSSIVGGSPLTGGEIGQNMSVVVSCNATTGQFDLVSGYDYQEFVTVKQVNTATCLNANVMQIDNDLVLLGTLVSGQLWQLEAQISYINNSAGGMGVQAEIVDFLTQTVTFANSRGFMPSGGGLAFAVLYMKSDPFVVANPIPGYCVRFSDTVGTSNGGVIANTFGAAAGFASWLRATRIG